MTNFLYLPDDILLEILYHLPALTILLCRQTCQKINQLSRERHLWIRIFNQTQYMLRPMIDVDQEGAFEVERVIVRAELLERTWSNEEELWIAPRYWRGAPCTPNHGKPVALMGDYVVFLSYIYHYQQTYTWVSIDDIDGPIAFKYAVPAWGIFTHYLDPIERTLFVLLPLHEPSLKVIGIQVGMWGPHVAIEYSVSLRSHAEVNCLTVDNGLVCINHCRHINDPDRFDFDVLDLERRTLSQFSLMDTRSILPPVMSPVLEALYSFATETHIIHIYGGKYFAVFRRSDQGVQSQNPVELFEPILRGQFPGFFDLEYGLHIIPRSSVSLAVVGIEQVGRHWLREPSQINIHLLYMDLSDSVASVKEVSSLTIPGELKSSVLPTPPLSAQYALGALSVKQRRQDGSVEDGTGYKCYALRINLPDALERGLAGLGRSHMTLNRMYLTPAVDEKGEEALFCHFNPFYGKALLSVNPSSPTDSVLVLDYFV